MEKDFDNIITIVDENGKELALREIASFAYLGKLYVFTNIVTEIESIDKDDVVLFESKKMKNGEVKLELVMDDDLAQTITSEYNKFITKDSK